jgi:hypothetical protein
MRPDKPIRLTGIEAAKLRQKKAAAVRDFHLPTHGLPGSLAQTQYRCGKSSCRCAREGEPGHPKWLLTYMVDGKKRVASVPADQVEEVRRRVEAGQSAKQALSDLLTANAEMLLLERKQRAKQRQKRK